LAIRDHVLALEEQEKADRNDPARLRMLTERAETLGAERAATRAKITTHLALSHSFAGRLRLMTAGAR
jgi:hypothetical protein